MENRTSCVAVQMNMQAQMGARLPTPAESPTGTAPNIQKADVIFVVVPGVVGFAGAKVEVRPASLTYSASIR